MDQVNQSPDLASAQPEQRQAEVLANPEEMTQPQIAQEIRDRLTSLKTLREKYLRGEIGPNSSAKKATA
jgi:hypothetical protein